MKKRWYMYFAILIALSCLCCGCGNQSKIQEIKNRNYILVGTTGDYRPMSYLESEDNRYWGFDIDLSKKIAESLGVEVKYVKTSWPTLKDDTQNESLYDIALSGITITDDRKESMLMSEGYLNNGKTILCRTEDVSKFKSIEDIDKANIRVMVNPGGLNEKFARANLKNAKIIVYENNEEIPEQIAEGNADIMITEILEAPYYVEHNKKLAAPLVSKPFTNGKVGVLLRKGNEELCDEINKIIEKYRQDGTLEELYKKYSFVNKG